MRENMLTLHRGCLNTARNQNVSMCNGDEQSGQTQPFYVVSTPDTEKLSALF